MGPTITGAPPSSVSYDCIATTDTSTLTVQCSVWTACSLCGLRVQGI